MIHWDHVNFLFTQCFQQPLVILDWIGHYAGTPSLWSLSFFGFWGLTCFWFVLTSPAAHSQSLCGSSPFPWLLTVSTLGPNLQISLLSCGFKWHLKAEDSEISNSGTDLFPSFSYVQLSPWHFHLSVSKSYQTSQVKWSRFPASLNLLIHFSVTAPSFYCSGQNLGLTLDSCVSHTLHVISIRKFCSCHLQDVLGCCSLSPGFLP